MSPHKSAPVYCRSCRPLEARPASSRILYIGWCYLHSMPYVIGQMGTFFSRVAFSQPCFTSWSQRPCPCGVPHLCSPSQAAQAAHGAGDSSSRGPAPRRAMFLETCKAPSGRALPAGGRDCRGDVTLGAVPLHAWQPWIGASASPSPPAPHRHGQLFSEKFGWGKGGSSEKSINGEAEWL
jgi:hypothetical protein